MEDCQSGFVVRHTFLELASETSVVEEQEQNIAKRRPRSYSDSAVTYPSDTSRDGKKEASDGETNGSTTAGSDPGSPAPELAADGSSGEEVGSCAEQQANVQQQHAFVTPSMQGSTFFQVGTQMYMMTLTPDGSQVAVPVSMGNMPMWGQSCGAPVGSLVAPMNLSTPSCGVGEESATSLEAKALALSAYASEVKAEARRAKAAAVAARRRLVENTQHRRRASTEGTLDFVPAVSDQTGSTSALSMPIASPRKQDWASVESDSVELIVEEEEEEEIENDDRTTLMFRNLPNNYTRAALLDMLDSEGFNGSYSFVYLPTDFKNFAGFGYAFVNFATHEGAVKAKAHFQNFASWRVPSRKVCDVVWSGPVQGLEAHTRRYRNSPVMHDSVPDEYKPAVFVDGKRVPFPAPTKRIRPPRVRHGIASEQPSILPETRGRASTMN